MTSRIPTPAHLALITSKLQSKNKNVFKLFLFNSKFELATKNEFRVHIDH